MIEILKKAFGIYETNCYILKSEYGDFIIDPGQNSTSWVLENVNNPLAILNTHGHFDHIWCNAELKDELKIPLLCPKDDAFMLKSDCFDLGLSPKAPDIEVENNEIFYFNANGLLDSSDDVDCIKVEYMFFPGHTPGCSMIKISDCIFSGDFIFKRSIGRSDFPYSSVELMMDSLNRFGKIDYDMPLYPGHGEATSIKAEQKNLQFYMHMI